MDRKKITFEQAEGIAPLPSQLMPKQISQELRALLWGVIHDYINEDVTNPEWSRSSISGAWEVILRDKHLFRDHQMMDEYNSDAVLQLQKLKAIYANGSYAEVLGLTEWIMRHPRRPKDMGRVVENALKYSKAAYRVVDGDTIVPIATEEEAAALKRAFTDLSTSEFKGARTHLKNAATALTSGKSADSVRESIHAVESVARALAPSAKLSDALAAIEAKADMHGSMRKAFTALYGYTSDEQGVRHPLLDEGDANVDEADALFMIGACAAFVSYMIAKGRAAGILKS